MSVTEPDPQGEKTMLVTTRNGQRDRVHARNKQSSSAAPLGEGAVLVKTGRLELGRKVKTLRARENHIMAKLPDVNGQRDQVHERHQQIKR